MGDGTDYLYVIVTSCYRPLRKRNWARCVTMKHIDEMCDDDMGSVAGVEQSRRRSERNSYRGKGYSSMAPRSSGTQVSRSRDPVSLLIEGEQYLQTRTGQNRTSTKRLILVTSFVDKRKRSNQRTKAEPKKHRIDINLLV